MPDFCACLKIFVKYACAIFPEPLISLIKLHKPIDSSCPGSPIIMSFVPVFMALNKCKNKSPPTILTSSKITTFCSSGLFTSLSNCVVNPLNSKSRWIVFPSSPIVSERFKLAFPDNAQEAKLYPFLRSMRATGYIIVVFPQLCVTKIQLFLRKTSIVDSTIKQYL